MSPSLQSCTDRSDRSWHRFPVENSFKIVSGPSGGHLLEEVSSWWPLDVSFRMSSSWWPWTSGRRRLFAFFWFWTFDYSSASASRSNHAGREEEDLHSPRPNNAARFTLDLSGPGWQLRSASPSPVFPATVPGDISDALWDGGYFKNLSHSLYYGINLRAPAVQALAYQSWWLNRTFELSVGGPGLGHSAGEVPTHYLLLDGVDYNATVFFDSEPVGLDVVGQFREWVFDVSGFIQAARRRLGSQQKQGASTKHEVAVLFHPPPAKFLDAWLAPGNAVQEEMYSYLDWWKSMVGREVGIFVRVGIGFLEEGFINFSSMDQTVFIGYAVSWSDFFERFFFGRLRNF